MRNILIYLIITCTAALYISCTDYELAAPEYNSKLVVDGFIEHGGFPRVVLSNSTSYFNEIDSSKIRNLLVTTAKVSVSDGINKEILTLKKDNRYFPPYIYEGTELKGEEGKSYTLTIELKGEKYTATTTIPERKKLNNLWFELSEGQDSLGYLFGNILDDPENENYYRLFTQREGKDKKFIPVYLSAIGDQFFNGKNFTFSILRGPENHSEVIDDLYFKKGETVIIKLCTMDKGHFDFWRTVERELYVVGNPFSSSGNDVISNIDGKKALGVWGGYGATYYKITIK